MTASSQKGRHFLLSRSKSIHSLLLPLLLLLIIIALGCLIHFQLFETSICVPATNPERGIERKTPQMVCAILFLEVVRYGITP